MSHQFQFKGSAILRHLNIRKEGDDEKVLKVDMKVEASTDMALPDYLDTGLRHFLWSAAGIVRNPLINKIEFGGEVPDCTAEVCGLHFTGVKVHKFRVEPKDSFRAAVTMTLTFEPTKTDVAILAERYAEDVDIDLRAQPSLLDDQKAGEGLGQASSAPTDDDELLPRARDIVTENRRASISLVQRHLAIGYNRAARLLEALERVGVVSPMAPNGHREVLMSA
jgi:hypothetical protein